MKYEQDLLIEVDAFDKLVKKYEAQAKYEKQAPVRRKARVTQGVWENLFAYGAVIGVFVQVWLWVRFAVR